MAQRPRLIALYAAAAAAMAAVAGGMLSLLLRAPAPVPVPAAAIVQPVEPPLTTTSPAAASNGRLTIRLIGGQAEK